MTKNIKILKENLRVVCVYLWVCNDHKNPFRGLEREDGRVWGWLNERVGCTHLNHVE